MNIKYILFLLILFLSIPVCSLALSDNLEINITAIPVWYGIDYGTSTSVVITQYAIQLPIEENDSLQSWGILGSNDGLFYAVIDIQQNQSFIADTLYTYGLSDTTPYKYYVILFDGGFTSMIGHALNLTIIAQQTGMSSFVLSNVIAANLTAPAFDTTTFVSKWWIVLIGIGLILFGLIIPLSTLFGMFVIIANTAVNASIYNNTEILTNILIIIVGVFILLYKLRSH